ALDEFDPALKDALAKIAVAETNLASFTNGIESPKPAKDAKVKSKEEKPALNTAARSNALAAARADFDKLPSELKDQHKRAKEKLAAADKALTDAEKEFKKAESARSTAE